MQANTYASYANAFILSARMATTLVMFLPSVVLSASEPVVNGAIRGADTELGYHGIGEVTTAVERESGALEGVPIARQFYSAAQPPLRFFLFRAHLLNR